jgi:hypothetical protein
MSYESAEVSRVGASVYSVSSAGTIGPLVQRPDSNPQRKGHQIVKTPLLPLRHAGDLSSNEGVTEVYLSLIHFKLGTIDLKID